MRNKKFISIILTIVMTLSLVLPFGTVFAGDVKIELFGEIIAIADGYGKPFIDAKTNRTLIPARAVFEEIQARVSWIAAERTVVITKGDTEVKVIIDSKTAYKNGKKLTLDQPAVIIGDRTYVPLRFVAESLDLIVDFDGATTTVKITTPGMEVVSKPTSKPGTSGGNGSSSKPNPTATPAPTAKPTAKPSNGKVYDGFDNAVFDFGQYYKIDSYDKADIGEIKIYKYDITETKLIKDGTFNRKEIRDGYVAQFTASGFAINSRIGQDPNSFYLYNSSLGLWVEIIAPPYFTNAKNDTSVEDPGVYYLQVRMFYGAQEV